ncbi:hypothetical protein LPJ70_006944, partial [Coemansia sp. RSA 2708]
TPSRGSRRTQTWVGRLCPLRSVATASCSPTHSATTGRRATRATWPRLKTPSCCTLWPTTTSSPSQ